MTALDEAALDEVARSASADAGGIPVDLLSGYLPVLLRAAASGARMDAAERAACHHLGVEAARRGVPFPAVVDLYLSAARLLWPHLPSLVRAMTGVQPPDADLLRMGAALLRAADDALSAVAGGLQEARQRMVQEEEAVRRDFIDDLLRGQGEADTLVQRAEQLGVQLTAHHLVAVIQTHRTATEVSRCVLPVQEQMQARCGSTVLVASRQELLACILPLPAGPDDPLVPRRLAEAAAAVSRQVLGTAPPRVSMGRAHAGARGVFRSFTEALEALEVAERLHLPDAIVLAGDLLVYRVLLRDREAMVELVDAVLTPLTRARAGAGPLVQTLEAYFAAGAVATDAARVLHLSVRAVTYRLQRVQDLTGYAPTDPAQRLPLQIAVVGAKLLQWPERPLPPT